MKKELDDKLVNDFPNLYRDRYGDPKDTCMCWGFPGDGWFNLIYDLSFKLESLILKLPEEKIKNCKAAQVKEKFGSLRFYLDGGSDEMYSLIQLAEELSEFICEECGEPGSPRKGGWIKTLCDNHAKGKKSIK